MARFIYGKIMGAIQLIFWIILIPWIILTIPVDLFYTTTSNIPPSWLQVILDETWIDWTFGIIVISTLNMGLFCFGLIWIGWQMMHPITENEAKPSNIDRLKLVKQFSKEKFLQKLHQEARNYNWKKLK